MNDKEYNQLLDGIVLRDAWDFHLGIFWVLVILRLDGLTQIPFWQIALFSASSLAFYLAMKFNARHGGE